MSKVLYMAEKLGKIGLNSADKRTKQGFNFVFITNMDLVQNVSSPSLAPATHFVFKLGCNKYAKDTKILMLTTAVQLSPRDDMVVK